MTSEHEKVTVSVVIASVNGYGYVAQCLRSLQGFQDRESVEVIVSECSGDDTASRLVAEFPSIDVVPSEVPRTIPELRALGIRRARGEIVVTTEDHCVFDENWVYEIVRAHRSLTHAAIGGAVENGSCERLVDWAAYICEYGSFTLPFAAGPAPGLAGPNVSYKRAVLEATCPDLLDRGVWENVLHDRLRSRGMTLWIDPSIVVYHVKRFEFWDFLAQRYYFGRSYAATRVAEAPWRERLFYTAISLFLPPLFLWRYAKCFVGKRRHVRELIRSFPLLVVFAVAWSVGEFFGYAFGDGGASLRVK